MAKFRIFRTPDPKKFNFIPRYYDPDEEERKERNEHLKRLKNKGTDGMKERISSGLKFRGGYTADKKMRKQAIRRSNMVMLGVVVFLVIISYGFIKVYLPQITEALQ